MTDDVVRAAVAGSRRERAQLLECIEPRVRVMVAMRLAPRADQLWGIDDLTQQVLVAVLDGLGGLQHQTAPGLFGFLHGIVVRQVAAELRRRRNTGHCQRPISLDTTIASLSQAGPLWQCLGRSRASPRTACERAEEAQRLLRELGRLPTRQRTALVLAFFCEMRTADVAGRLGIGREAAAMLISRGLQSLRRRFGEVRA